LRISFLLWIKTNRVMLLNTGSLIGTTFVTSALGFVYWWLAAHLFAPEAVGLASAAVSAMMLLATISLLGTGTLLIGELPRQPGKERSLVSTMLIVVGVVGGIAGIVFALLTTLVSKDLQSLRSSPVSIAIFAAGVSLTSITLVLDQALVGILQSQLQLWRNALFAAAKLVALLLAGLYLSYKLGLTIYATWAIGNVFSLVALFGFVVVKGKWSFRACLPQWGLLRKLKTAALQHHILNLANLAPALILPMLVTVMLSARVNAWFYVSLTLANFVSVILYALTSVLYAMNAADPAGLARQIRLTLGLSLASCMVANGLLFFGARWILGMFGADYAEQATWSLRILALGAFPIIIKDHYLALSRIHSCMGRAMHPIIFGALLEVVGPVLGAHFGGLLWLSLGWVLSIVVEAVYMAPAVYQAMHTRQTSNIIRAPSTPLLSTRRQGL
jgi:O-antigen/teichoic acid export membrane protein